MRKLSTRAEVSTRIPPLSRYVLACDYGFSTDNVFNKLFLRRCLGFIAHFDSGCYVDRCYSLTIIISGCTNLPFSTDYIFYLRGYFLFTVPFLLYKCEVCDFNKVKLKNSLACEHNLSIFHIVRIHPQVIHIP